MCTRVAYYALRRSNSLGQAVLGGVESVTRLQIREVRSARDRESFARAGRLLHHGTPQFVPPLDREVADYIDPKKNPFFAEADVEHFLATRDGEVVGRIAAVVEHRYVARFGKLGWFGWFDCVNDVEVARALLERAESWLRAAAMQRVEGPYSYDATQEFGLLTAGFDQVPALLQPHHESYYLDLVRSCGYEPRFGTRTYSWGAEDAAAMEAVRRRGEAVLDRGELTVRSFDKRHAQRDIDLLWDLFLATFSEQHDMLPMTRRMFDWQFAAMRPFVDPRLIRIVELQGRPVAFSFLVADANEVLAHAGGRPGVSFYLRYPLLRRRVSGAVILMIGVLPGMEGTGAGRVLGAQIADVALGRVRPYRQVHTTWIHEENQASLTLVGRTGSPPRRTYTVVGKDL